MTGASQTTPRESRLLHAASLLTIGIAAWTVLTTIAGVIAESCNLPYADEWDLWTSLLRHGYSLGWFFEPHNDHRIATTRLIFAASHLIFHGRIWVPQATSLTVQVVLAVLLWKFARRLSAPGPADGILAGTFKLGSTIHIDAENGELTMATVESEEHAEAEAATAAEAASSPSASEAN